MASSVTVHIVNIRVNTVNLGVAPGNSISLMLAICTVTLEAMQYLYNNSVKSLTTQHPVEQEECINVGGQHTHRKPEAAHKSSTEGTNPTSKPFDNMTSDGSCTIIDMSILHKLETYIITNRMSTTLSQTG